MEFPGQGSDPSCRWKLSYSCGNGESQIHCAGPGIKIVHVFFLKSLKDYFQKKKKKDSGKIKKKINK